MSNSESQSDSESESVSRSDVCGVTHSESQSGVDVSEAEVLTLPEVAAFLRVPEKDILALIVEGSLPAQKIGDELRLLKRAVVEWLNLGHRFPVGFSRLPPPWFFDFPFVWEERLQALELRILSTLAAVPPSADRGSKQAVLKHFGIFQGDADLDDQLASNRTRRKAAGQ